MKVKDLIDELNKHDPDDIIVLSKDEEGNGFSVLEDVEEMAFSPEYGEVKYRKLTPAMEKQGYSEEDVFSGSEWKMCIVLWP